MTYEFAPNIQTQRTEVTAANRHPPLNVTFFDAGTKFNFPALLKRVIVAKENVGDGHSQRVPES